MNAKIPPHSTEAEQYLITALLLNEDSFNDIAGRINETHFYHKQHKTIFHHCSKLQINNKNINIITLTESLKLHNELESIGGIEYLENLLYSGLAVTNVISYADVILERFILRELINASRNIGEMAYSPKGKSGIELIDEAEQLVFNIRDINLHDKQFLHFPLLLDEVVEAAVIAASRLDKSSVTGLATHYIDLDKHTSGLHPGELIIIAGRPGMGKTAFALNIAENIALKSNKAVAFFSLEMTAVQLTQRIVSSYTKISQTAIRHGTMTHHDMEKLYKVKKQLQQAQFFIAEASGINVIEMRAKARRLAAKQPLSLIVIDYIQIMSTVGNNSNSNRAYDLAEISRSLKSLALELKVPIIVLSQLNRDVESRNDKRPNIADLRESGALEQDADIILLLYRDGYYNKDSDPDNNVSEINIAKNRNGSTGVVNLAFFPQFTRFENLAENW